MAELKKNQKYIVDIEGFTSDGSGVARVDGRAVFVRGALPGEKWEICLHKVTSSAVYAGGVECLKASPNRMPADCPHFRKCGGCDLRHMSYAAELEFKLSRVNDAIKRIGGLDFRVDDILGCENINSYRNKAIYSVGMSNGVPVAGFYRPRSHDIVPISRCLIQRQEADDAAAAVCRWMKDNHISPYDEATGRGHVRHIFLRSSLHGGLMVCVVSARGFGSATQSLVDFLRLSCPEITSIILCINKNRLNSVLSGEFHTLWGSDIISEDLCGLKFRLSPLSFFQINPPQAEKLYKKALDFASPKGDATVLDLYCGTGTITLCLARGARKVIGAEIVPDAVRDALENARDNGIANAEFICADAAEVSAELAQRGLRPDAIVVDPPRKGLDKKVIDSIVQMSPQRLVYVSCDPGTLARDMKLLAQSGYDPSDGLAVDMFPRTRHVETVVLLSR